MTLDPTLKILQAKYHSVIDIKKDLKKIIIIKKTPRKGLFGMLFELI